MTADQREALVRTARAMAVAGLCPGTSGNLSVRGDGGFWVTPTGRPYTTLQPDDVPFVRLDGSVEGGLAPSSEWRLHRDVLAARSDAGAVLHAHPPAGVALASTRRALPAFHYQVARFGGGDVRCAPYAPYGTQELSDAAVVALEGRHGCLLANHGTVVCGRDLDHALALGTELETLCEQYARAQALGGPVLLTAAEVADAARRLAGYGQP